MSESKWYRSLIEKEAAQDPPLDPDLVEAIVRVESSGLAHAYRYEPAFWQRYLADNPDYRNMNPRRASASYGLMQVMYPTAVERGLARRADPEVLFQPFYSLLYGCEHLRRLLAWSKGNVDQALAAYNGGKAGNSKPPYRNRGYVEKVHAALAQIKKERA
jgi:soluble lytic murein transglycosylase-like protein